MKIIDPFSEREALRYENPIPSREFILQYLSDKKKAVTRDQLVKALNLKTDEQKEALRRRLRAMEREGQVSNRRGSYTLLDKSQLITGRVVGHKDGFGFVIPEANGGDLFLGAREMRSVFDGDKVVVRVLSIDHRGRREGSIVEVLERNTEYVVGRFLIEEGIGFVVPDNKRISQNIIVPAEKQQDARHGQIVVVKIIEQPTLWHQASGQISEILGEHMAPGMEIDVAIRVHELPYKWPQELLKEISTIKNEVPQSAIKNRKDLRKLPLVTIDGADAKDFDDAVFCQPRAKGGWQLFVAIADVSHYVKTGTALDEEALHRGNSVYFPGRVIPMLPEILSNELCSLKPKVDRLCMVCEMTITPTGKITKYLFYDAVMHSKARLTYDEVADMLLKKNKSLKTRYGDLLPHIEELYRLYKVLRSSRNARGAIDFDTIETRVIFGPKRKIKEIVPVVRNEAHKIIEECMLAANVCSAQFLLKNNIPALYRIHAGPTPEKLLDLRSFLGELGLALRGGNQPSPKDYGELLRSIQGRPDQNLIQTVLLRSLSQAVYSPKNAGHFGLAYEAYAHFTSPIRRYPDLLVHRAIQHLLNKKPIEKFNYDKNKVTSLGEWCSTTERRADEATRDALDWLKCEFMLDHVGEVFDGIISSVTGFGIFVMLNDIYIEGLVHITALKDDYYQYDSARHRLRGERGGFIYRLGDKIRIRVVRVDLEQKRLDFELLETKQKKPTKKKAQKKKRK